MEHEGRVFPRLRLLPDRELANQYWAALGVDSPPQALPPTYLIFLRAERLGIDLFKELGIPRQQALHGGQRYEWFVPVGPDDALDVDIRVERVAQKQSKSGPLSFVDVSFDYRLASSGALAVREITRLIKRGA
jgi:hypothetical protein